MGFLAVLNQQLLMTIFKGVLTSAISLLLLIVAMVPMLFFTLVKLVLPIPKVTSRITRYSVDFAKVLIGIFRKIYMQLHSPEWQLSGQEGLEDRGIQLLVCNHQSWSDCLIMALALHRKIPFYRFFVKRQLLWIPLIAIVGIALDMPFLRRYSKQQLDNNPALRSKDLQATKQMCDRLEQSSATIVNFAEGTRFTEQKRLVTNSPYQFLLPAKAGGLAYVITSMKGKINEILDVTLIYEQGNLTFWDFLCGRTSKVAIHIKAYAVPANLRGGDYQGSSVYRDNFTSWTRHIWECKEALIASSIEHSIKDYRLASKRTSPL